MSNRKFSLIARPNSIPYTDNEGNFSESWKEKFGGSGVSTLQVQVSYNNEVLGNCSVVVDNTTIVTKSNGLATFTGLTKGEKVIEATKSGFLVATDTKQVANSFDFTDIEMTPLTITFTIKDDQNQVLVGATVNFNNESKQTDSNGQVVFSQVGIGTKPYTVIMLGYTTLEGTITVEYENETINIIMTSALIVGKAEGTYAAGDTVKLNAGMGLNNYDWTAYPSDTTTTNDLTIEGEVASIETDSLKLTSTPSPDGADITVNVDQDDAEIKFNNNDEIDQVKINVFAKDLYLAFIKGADTIYFKNNTLPFIASENTFESKSYTYYTYENSAMVSHNATTSSVTGDGANRYNGITLNIDTSDTFSNGIWTKDNNKDLEIDNGDATITTSSYLTDVNPIIPRTDNFIFSCAKLNPAQWNTKLIIGGQEKQFIDNQEFYVKSNQLIEIYATKHNSIDMKDTYNKYFYISNDKHYKKVNFIISSSEANTTFKFIINGVEFEYTGSTANIDCYEGETINWELSKTGFVTQTGSYTVSSYPTIKTYDAGTKTLVAE